MAPGKFQLKLYSPFPGNYLLTGFLPVFERFFIHFENCTFECNLLTVYNDIKPVLNHPEI